YHTKKHDTTGYTSFQLLYGKQATLLIKTILPIQETETDEIDLQGSILQQAYELIDKLSTAHKQAQQNIAKSQQKQIAWYTKKFKYHNFKVGDLVLVAHSDIAASRSVKFEEKFK
ncbi:6498_t:CDS:1, partial [Racocetra persica]